MGLIAAVGVSKKNCDGAEKGKRKGTGEGRFLGGLLQFLAQKIGANHNLQRGPYYNHEGGPLAYFKPVWTVLLILERADCV